MRNFEPEALIESWYGSHTMVAFQNSMLSLMQGCLCLVEQEKVQVAADEHQGASVLAQLYLKYHEPLPSHRPFYVEMAKQQWQAVHAVIKLQCREAAPQVSCPPGSMCSAPLDGSAGE